jgi:predicted phage terminase large subunit-like protein
MAFPAWILGKRPYEKVFGISNKEKLSNRNTAMTRQIMQHPQYRSMFPEVKITKDTETHFKTSQLGERQSFTTMGGITGEGANYLIFDDYMSAHIVMSDAERTRALELFDTAFKNRLNNELEDVRIIVEQRLHPKDLTGYLLSQNGKYEHLCLPAEFSRPNTFIRGDFKKDVVAGEVLNPVRLPKSLLDEYREKVVDEETGVANGKQMYCAQYLQSPIVEGGNMVDIKWFKRFDLSSAPFMEFDSVVVSADTASKATELNDPSAFLKFGIKGNFVYLLDIYNKRAEYPDTKRNLINFCNSGYQANTLLIEDANTGSSLIQELRRETNIGIVPISHGGIKKEIRFSNSTGQMANGNVFFPKEAPWLFDFETQLMQFPMGENDDMCDSFSIFMIWNRDRNINFAKYFFVV